MISMIAEIRKRVPGEVFDYQVLMDALSMYSKPRDAVTRLLINEELIRIKKGLYCFNRTYQHQKIRYEYVANLIYGPSYISLEYALYYYGLIPEEVTTVTSVTAKRSKEFNTPLCNFSYRTLTKNRYCPGYVLNSTGTPSFLIATPEKALADKVWADKRFDGVRISEYEQYLFEDLRLDREMVRKMDRELMLEISDSYNSAKIRNLITYLERIWRADDA